VGTSSINTHEVGIDGVIRPGVAYAFLEGEKGEGVPNGLLRAKAALIFNTSKYTCRERTIHIWRSLRDNMEKL